MGKKDKSFMKSSYWTDYTKFAKDKKFKHMKKALKYDIIKFIFFKMVVIFKVPFDNIEWNKNNIYYAKVNIVWDMLYREIVLNKSNCELSEIIEFIDQKIMNEHIIEQYII